MPPKGGPNSHFCGVSLPAGGDRQTAKTTMTLGGTQDIEGEKDYRNVEHGGRDRDTPRVSDTLNRVMVVSHLEKVTLRGGRRGGEGGGQADG